MFRGFLSGGLLGLVVSGVTLGTVSLVGEQPAGDRPPMAPEVDAPGMAEGGGDIVGGVSDPLPGGSTDPGGAPAPSMTPEVAQPTTDPVLPDADTASPVAPVAAEAEPGLGAPAATTEAPAIVAGAEAPVLPNPLTRAPEPPVAEALVEVPSDPAVPPLSDTTPEQPTGGLAPPAPSDPIALTDPTVSEAAPVIADTAPSPAPETAPDAAVVADSETADRPAAETESVADQAVVALADTSPTVPSTTTNVVPAADAEAPAMANPTAPGLPPAEVVEIAPQPEEPVVEPEPEVVAPEPELIVVVEPDPEPVAAPDLEPVAAAEPEPVAEPEVIVIAEPLPEATEEPTPEADPDSDPETAPAEAPAQPRIALRGSDASLPGNTAAVRIIRPSENAPEADAEVAEETPDPALSDDAPALLRYAASYENPEGKPLMAIILIDDGGLGGGAVAAVGAVPFPVTVAIDALAADAAEKMQAYRAAGVEVMALASLPEGALPSDVEVTLEAAFGALPETIALLDAGAGGLQSDRGVTEQAMAHLAQAGRGFVTKSQGLNMALRSAEAADVPAAVIYRDLDSEGQDARVIRRFLDQAAFRARQQSGVVLVGRVRADTISALSLWGTANRAGQVTLAPVSAALSAE